MDKALQDLILSTTRGTKTGAILRCAIGNGGMADGQPYFTGKASVTSDGYILCDYVDIYGEGHHGAFVGSLEELDANLLRLCEHMDLSRPDREQLPEAA